VDVAASFADDTPHNIWNDQPEDTDESDTPAFLRRRKKNKKTDEA
jgi:hypothetical protein